jgi:hypothetical protein
MEINIKGCCVMNVKQGDMAILIKTGQAGAIGEVKYYFGVSPINPLLTVCWAVEFTNGINAVKKDGTKIKASVVVIPDEWLKPVSGLPTDEDIKQEETV